MAAFRCSTQAVPRGLMILFGAFAPLLLAGTTQGQRAEETARQKIRLRAFGGFSYVRPDYSGSPRNQGFTLGGDIDGIRLFPRTDIGLDARYTRSMGPVITETFYGGGPRVTVNFARFKPYADFLYGNGIGNFNNTNNPNYTTDNTAVATFGGGLDYQLTRTWAVRAEAQQQRWRFSIHQQPFHPTVVTVGLSYQFHFHGRTGPDL